MADEADSGSEVPSTCGAHVGGSIRRQRIGCSHLALCPFVLGFCDSSCFSIGCTPVDLADQCSLKPPLGVPDAQNDKGPPNFMHGGPFLL